MTISGRTLVNLAAVGLVVWLVAGKPGLPVPSPGPTPAVYQPSLEWQALVAPVTQAMAGKSREAALVEKFYQEFAEIVERDAEVIKTTGQIRQARIAASKLMFERLNVALPLVARAIDDVLVAKLGLENKALDASSRAQTVEAFRAVAWAAGRAK